MKTFWFLFIGLFSLPTWANNCEQVDNQLSQHYSRMQSSGSYTTKAYIEGMLEQETEAFKKALAFLKDSASWQCNFEKAQNEGVAIHTSADKQLRAFSWDWQTGGTMHEFAYLLQYRLPNGKTETLLVDNYDRVIAVQQATLNQKTYYWVMSHFTGDGRNHGLGANLYQITEKGVVPAKMIKTSTLTNAISFAYDPIEASENRKVNRVAFIYDDNAKTLRFPVIGKENAQYGSGAPTGKWIEYRFNGQYFIREKN